MTANFLNPLAFRFREPAGEDIVEGGLRIGTHCKQVEGGLLGKLEINHFLKV